MPAYQVLLTDVETESLPSLPNILNESSTGVALPGSQDWSVARRTLQGGLAHGVDVIDLCSGPLTVSVLPTRGMGLWRASTARWTAGWNAPVKQPVHPAFVNLKSRNGLGWLDGFQELLCRCGLSFNGPPGTDDDAVSPIESEITLHGRIANIPAHRVTLALDSNGPGSITLTGEMDEATLFGPQLRLTSAITLAPGSARFEIMDQVQNLSSRPGELQLLYHTNIGPPVLEGGASFLAPIKTVAPRDGRAAEDIASYQSYLPPTPGYTEQAYFFELIADDSGMVPALLHNAAGDLGFLIEFEQASLPCFTLWKCTQPESDGYVTGLEPGTNYPNFKSHERKAGRVVTLEPGEIWSARLVIELLDSAEQVSSMVEKLASLQSGTSPTIHSEPHPDYSAL